MAYRDARARTHTHIHTHKHTHNNNKKRAQAHTTELEFCCVSGCDPGRVGVLHLSISALHVLELLTGSLLKSPEIIVHLPNQVSIVAESVSKEKQTLFFTILCGCNLIACPDRKATV